MASEETRLLQDDDCQVNRIITEYGATVKPYHERFSSRKKWSILGIISCCGLIPFFVSGSFFPTIPEVSRDLNTTASIVSLTVSISVFAASIGGLFGATYSGFYGRKPIYLFSLPLLVIGSVGVGLSMSIRSLMIWRFFQTMGGAPGISVGAGVVGDIFRLEERGTAMGIFFGACLLGPALSPFLGGVVAEYFSWRIMQLSLGFFGLIILLLVAAFLPETSIPGTRGIDKRRQRLHALGKSEDEVERELGGFVWLNPFKPLLLLRSPVLSAVAVGGGAVLITDYVLLVPLAYTVGARYNITSSAALGMCFIPIGMGNCTGAYISGYISDILVVSYRAARGAWYPEDRLRVTLLGAGLFAPLSMVGVAVGVQWASGLAGFILCLLSLFFNGIGVNFVLSPISAYVVDILHDKSAESMAATNAFRAFLMAILIAPIFPLIQNVGVVWTNLIAASSSVIFGFGFLWLVIHYGDALRTWADVGFSTTTTEG
ncbi:MFS general substrate transporter [Dendrothele bispora CBS 962.96]|uniref:MFS general substrate transporter n=1 Tax=Dendrothele bispora (strain CBS 962.96) TaxID=1314807 RepID=A0A4S8MUH1_DENBC|nr:MFS general substrate transporter [Dendrothele bispora CBS 962.96]